MLTEPYLSRFLARRDTSGGPDACWTWRGAIDGGGYGTMEVLGKTVRAHVIAVQLDGRDIPAGMTVDHLCRNRSCSNARHLEVVTRGENVRRGVHPHKTHCPRGHATGPGGRTKRGNCLECHRQANRERMRRKVQDATARRPLRLEHGTD